MTNDEILALADVLGVPAPRHSQLTGLTPTTEDLREMMRDDNYVEDNSNESPNESSKGGNE